LFIIFDFQIYIKTVTLPALAKILIIAGLLLVAAGVLVWLAQDHLSWLGQLLGNVRVEHPGMKFYFPITKETEKKILFVLIIPSAFSAHSAVNFR
jgi:hypothetical protein